jgi:sugar phosphate isomerase/epimerase
MKRRLAGNRAGAGAGTMQLTDLPRFTREMLNLYGLNVSTNLLAGADFQRLDQLRDAADKASCPCLVLIESEPQPFTDPNEAKGEQVVDRVGRVIQAANRLGCNSAAVAVCGADTPAGFAEATDRFKRILHAAERLEVNLLLMSHPGLTASPERLTDLIKKIGGFRVGTFPDFQAASASENPTHFLRRLTPYASALTASSVKFAPAKKPPGFVHEPYDLAGLAATVTSVGYTGTIAIDYRGEDDPETGIVQTRTILEAALGKEALPE